MISKSEKELTCYILQLLKKYPNEWNIRTGIRKVIKHQKSGIEINCHFLEWTIISPKRYMFNIINSFRIKRTAKKLFASIERGNKNAAMENDINEIKTLVKEHIGDNKFITDL